ncbi:hypothetical protein AMJ44_08975 [candidate division WOR-1 bacterium DG_54_3]|uniref:Periplasmic heavy metal sensor n=1 Tax=candidate division WOR-1 bacterium DG_54_3 TaxID=1703775 RepID=A0A0S7XV45_UNCSA|nr:MAG: hypothetical protein AMJ44_08975 [candidate division WOR-1 bacterium DG_54_3]
MKINKVVVGVLVVFLTVVLASEAFAWWGKEKRPAPEQRSERIAKRLELTEEQKAKFKDQREKMQKYVEGTRDEFRELGKKLKTELEKDNPNRATVQSLIRKIGQKQTEMQLRRMDSLLELRKILTSEQRQKFKKMLGPGQKRGFRSPPKFW